MKVGVIFSEYRFTEVYIYIYNPIIILYIHFKCMNACIQATLIFT